MSKFLYMVNPRIPLTIENETIRRSKNLELDIEGVKHALKHGPVYRKFDAKTLERVTLYNINEMHKAVKGEVMTEVQESVIEPLEDTSIEETMEVQEPTIEPVEDVPSEEVVEPTMVEELVAEVQEDIVEETVQSPVMEEVQESAVTEESSVEEVITEEVEVSKSVTEEVQETVVEEKVQQQNTKNRQQYTKNNNQYYRKKKRNR